MESSNYENKTIEVYLSTCYDLLINQIPDTIKML